MNHVNAKREQRKQSRLVVFRSIHVDAEMGGAATLSTGDNDDRITPIGKIIYKTRIDELPQLFNIFIGNMPIVGLDCIIGAYQGIT